MTKVPMENIDLKYDKEWSFKNFTNCGPINQDLSGKVIYASCFYNETPNTVIFPKDMKGVTFIKCNLDNIIVPEGNTLIESYNRWIQAQSDGQDWYVYEDDLEPIVPFNYVVYFEKGMKMPSPEDLKDKK